MAAPVTSTRILPSGAQKLKDGYQSFIVPSSNPGFRFWEKSVQLPGIDGGEKIDITTMHNSIWRVNAARSLKTLTPLQISGGHSPSVTAGDIQALINVNQSWTVRCPNGDTISFYAFLKSYVPSANTEGAFPEATLTLEPTNVDNTGAEQSPIYTTGIGS